MKLLCLLLSGAAAFGADTSVARDVIAAEIPKEETGLEADHATGDWGGLRTRLVDRGVHLYAGYAGEVLGNVSGGIRRGAVYEGLLELSVELDTAKLGAWQNGYFRVSSLYPHGASVSREYVGDILAASNIDAYDSLRLYELWYEHRFFDARFSVRAGQLAGDEEFAFTEAGGEFLNSAFGWPAFISANVRNTGPAFFVAAPSLRVRYEASDEWYVQAGVFDGDTFDDRDGNPRVNRSGTRIHLSDEQGALGIFETGYRLNQAENSTGLPGTYKLGAWIHTADFDSHTRDEAGGEIARTGLAARTHSPNCGVYAAAEQMIWREQDEQGVTFFARAGVAPRDRNLFDFVTDLGVTCTGLIPSRDEDVVGVGFVHARVSRDVRRFERLDTELNGTDYPAFSDHESLLEAFYSLRLKNWWTLQPDVQWIFNPGGSSALSDAVVVGLRTLIVF